MAFVVSLLLGRVLAHLAPVWGLIDHPGAHRDHEEETPLVGGLAIYISFLLISILFLDYTEFRGLLIGGGLLVTVGALDDRVELATSVRFVAQILAVMAIIYFDGVQIFTASHQQLVAIWDGASGQRLQTLTTQNQGITSARFSTDERLLLIGYVNRAIELWDVTAGKRLHRWTTEARNLWHPAGAAIIAVGFGSSSSNYYALAGDGRLMLLNRS